MYKELFKAERGAGGGASNVNDLSLRELGVCEVSIATDQ